MKRILIIEDDREIRELLQFFLEQEGYLTRTAADGFDGLSIFDREKVDLVLLDVLLPGMDGYEVCRQIRRRSQVPVLMISAKGEEAAQIRGYRVKADDYLPKPLSMPIVLGKIEAVLRRSECGGTREHVRICGEIRVEPESHSVWAGGKPVSLTKKEFDILEMLVAGQGRVITRELMLERFWDYEFYGDVRVVDTHIKNLRKKLGDAGTCIETIRGIGYRMREK